MNVSSSCAWQPPALLSHLFQNLLFSPSPPFLALNMRGFLWNRTFLFILLLENQSLPAVLSLCSPCTGNFFCISVNCLATLSVASAGSPASPLSSSSVHGWVRPLVMSSWIPRSSCLSLVWQWPPDQVTRL